VIKPEREKDYTTSACELLLSLRIFSNQVKQKLILSLSLHGIGISPPHTVTYNHRYQPEAERDNERERTAEKGRMPQISPVGAYHDEQPRHYVTKVLTLEQ
jgi:hypothetical protein